MTDLILIPTEQELARLRPQWPEPLPQLAICGFGLVAAAARTMQLLQRHQPRRVWLIGIAGSLHPSLAIGTAAEFSAVAVEGIGVGWHKEFQSAAAIGWPQWPGDDDSPAISDRLRLSPGGGSAPGPTASPGGAGLLLSVAAASQDADQARWRQQRFPEAVAEDMEGFAVAFACGLAGVPCRIVRGISNRAGDRDLKRWQIEAALAAAARLLIDRLSAAADEPAPVVGPPIKPSDRR